MKLATRIVMALTIIASGFSVESATYIYKNVVNTTGPHASFVGDFHEQALGTSINDDGTVAFVAMKLTNDPRR